jgi:hypothetical protein
VFKLRGLAVALLLLPGCGSTRSSQQAEHQRGVEWCGGEIYALGQLAAIKLGREES